VTYYTLLIVSISFISYILLVSATFVIFKCSFIFSCFILLTHGIRSTPVVYSDIDEKKDELRVLLKTTTFAMDDDSVRHGRVSFEHTTICSDSHFYHVI